VAKELIKINNPTTYKKITNKSVQGLSVIIVSGSGFKSAWLAPKQQIMVLESEITQQIKNLHKRRLISIEN
jgi:flagellar biosynthesis chaperone FliJ